MTTTIDLNHETKVLYSPICCMCVNWYAGKWTGEGPQHTCSAFPDGIPDEIWNGENNHQKPYLGDKGIQFKQNPRAK
jgi:hypothetical protein